MEGVGWELRVEEGIDDRIALLGIVDRARVAQPRGQLRRYLGQSLPGGRIRERLHDRVVPGQKTREQDMGQRAG